MIIYIYDLILKNNEINRVKRNFYYHLNKLKSKDIIHKNKSCIIVPEHLEYVFDAFFLKYNGKISVLKVYSDEIIDFITY